MTEFLDPKGKFGMSFENALREQFPEQMPEVLTAAEVGPWWLEILWSSSAVDSDGSWRRSMSHGQPTGHPSLYAAWDHLKKQDDRSYLLDRDEWPNMELFRYRFVYSPGGPPPRIPSYITMYDLGGSL